MMYNPWAHAAITQRTITLLDMTYNFKTDLNVPVMVPDQYYGQVSKTILLQNSKAK